MPLSLLGAISFGDATLGVYIRFCSRAERCKLVGVMVLGGSGTNLASETTPLG